ncbi:hypothetical protein HYV73_03735 [Candidatus Uhrbacteria bacterium]|nr:hypothetical protein [Candidatus Uhrbacteria bacterium]
MSYKQFLLIMALGSILAWAGFGSVVFSIDPTQGSLIAFLLFYATLAFSLGATMGLLLLLGRHRFDRDTIASRQVSDSLRQGIWFSLLFIFHLVLLEQKFFAWYTSLPLVLFFAAVEGVWQSLRRPHPVLPTPQ